MTDTYNATLLANMADVALPDGPDSPGAQFLEAVQDMVLDYTEYESVENMSDMAHEIADGCVPIYTHQMWTAFTDLGAYREDITDLAGPIEDMEKAAQTALYMIGVRLAEALIKESEEK